MKNGTIDLIAIPNHVAGSPVPKERRDRQVRTKLLVHLDEELAIIVRKLGPALTFVSQSHQLMSEYRIRCLEPAPRLAPPLR